MLSEEECSGFGTSDTIRCRRQRPDGTKFDYGSLIFDASTNRYRIHPSGGDLSAETFDTAGAAMAALEAFQQHFYQQRLIELKDAIARTQETIELIGASTR